MFFNDLKFTKHLDVRTAMDRVKITSLLQTTRACSKVHISSEGIIQHSNTNQNQVQRSSLSNQSRGQSHPASPEYSGAMSQSATSKSIKITGHEIRLSVDRQWIANGSLDLLGSPLDRLDRILVLKFYQNVRFDSKRKDSLRPRIQCARNRLHLSISNHIYYFIFFETIDHKSVYPFISQNHLSQFRSTLKFWDQKLQDLGASF